MDGFYELICFTFYPCFEQGFYLQMKIQCNRTIILSKSNNKSLHRMVLNKRMILNYKRTYVKPANISK